MDSAGPSRTETMPKEKSAPKMLGAYYNSKDLDEWLDGMISNYTCHPLSPRILVYLCSQVASLFDDEPNVLILPAPIIAVGDLHGHLWDLLGILKEFKLPPKTTYLFLGDYVDRGYSSILTITLLFALKFKFPRNIFLLRGNHEEGTYLNDILGFSDDCKRLYGDIWALFTFQNVFQFLPVAAVVNNQVFCCHGGLSPELKTIDDISNKDRKQLILDDRILRNLLWMDPYDELSTKMNFRGIGKWDSDLTDEFLERNSLKLILRAHEWSVTGYRQTHNDCVTTIFSATSYGNLAPNCGTIAVIKKNGVFIQRVKPVIEFKLKSKKSKKKR